MWLLLSSIPLVLSAEFVSPGLKVDAMASDERKGNRVSIRRKIVCFCESGNLRWPAERSPTEANLWKFLRIRLGSEWAFFVGSTSSADP